MGDKCMNLPVERFRSKASAANPPSPVHHDCCTLENVDFIDYRDCDTVFEGGGDHWGDLKYSLLIFNVHTIMD